MTRLFVTPILVLLIATFFIPNKVSAQSSSPRQLKRDAITALDQISTTDKKLRRIIRRASKDISRSLEDKGQSLFLDEFRIVPPSRGEKVFEREREAVDRLLKAIKRKRTSEDIKTILQEVIEALVEADRGIAGFSIATAQQLVQAGEGNARKLAKAEREFEKALQETDPRKVIQRFKKAWESSQKVVEDGELVIKTFDDAPDPFSPNLTTNTLTATFRIGENGKQHEDNHRDKEHGRGHKDDDGKEQRRFLLEFVEIIQDSSNATVRTLTTQHAIPPLPGSHKDRFIDLTVASVWDGRNDQGAIVPDGTYSYLAFGRLIRDKKHGKKREHVEATSFPVSGTILLDNTPPVIIASVDPSPNAAGWHNTDVTVSFAATDNLSGIASVSPDVVVSTKGAGQVVTGTATDLAGNSATTSVTLNIDKTGPTVSIIFPPDGTTVRESQVTMTGTASDLLSGVAGVTCNGAPAFVSGSAFSCDLSLAEGENLIVVEATDLAGNSGTSSITVIFVRGPVVTITDPASLSLFSASPINVSGTVDDPSATVVVNGVPASAVGGIFTANGVPLKEGSNIITATATDAFGNVGTASITVSLDTTPPTVLIDAPFNGQIIPQPTIAVGGMINDIVTGTVNGDDAIVTVNGIQAQVLNRTFVVPEIPLRRGPNTITAIAQDRAGNTSTHSVSVTFQEFAGQGIGLVSGNNQSGLIGSTIVSPLVVSLTDTAGNPVSGRPVNFKVTRGDGTVSGSSPERSVIVVTDGAGQAQVFFTLGTRTGAGNHRVTATATGFVGEVTFCTSALPAAASGIKTISGENQTGVGEQSLPEPFVVFVHDTGGNPVQGVPVTFEVLQGGGNISGQPTVTRTSDSDGRAAAVLTLGPQEGLNNNVVNVTFPGLPGLPAVFTASGFAPGNAEDTSVSGVVLDNSNNPIPGVTARILGTPLETVTDDQGQFNIPGAPVGTITLEVDGSTTTLPGTWPMLDFDLTTISGRDNTIGMPIFLLPLDTVNAKVVGGPQDVTLQMANVPGLALTVFANSVTCPDGSDQCQVTITQVH